MELPVDRGAGSFNVRDVENLPVGATGVAQTEGLTHDRARAVAAGDVARCTDLFLPVRFAQACRDVIAAILEPLQGRPPLDRYAKRLQTVDQQPFVLVLGEYLQERIGREAFTHGLEREARGRSAFHP